MRRILTGNPLPGDYKELAEVESLEMNEDGLIARRAIMCRWDERYFAAMSVFAFDSPYPNPLPDQFQNTVLVVKSHSFEGMGPTGDGRVFEEWPFCKVTAVYRTPPYLGQEFNFSVEALETTEGRVWEKVSAEVGKDVHVEIPTSITMPTAEINIPCRRWSVPYRTIIQTTGRINKNDYSEGWGIPKHTLLMVGAQTRQGVTSFGQTYWDVVYRFIYRNRSWNEVWRAPRQLRDADGVLQWKDEKNQLDPIYVKGPVGKAGWDVPVDTDKEATEDGRYLYDEADFTYVFPQSYMNPPPEGTL